MVPLCSRRKATEARGVCSPELHETPPVVFFCLGDMGTFYTKNRRGLRLADISRTPSGTFFSGGAPYLGNGMPKFRLFRVRELAGRSSSISPNRGVCGVSRKTVLLRPKRPHTCASDKKLRIAMSKRREVAAAMQKLDTEPFRLPRNLEGCWFCGCVWDCVYESAARPETQTRELPELRQESNTRETEESDFTSR